MQVQIKNRWTDEVLYATEVDDDDPYPIRTAVSRASLDGARLDGARLDGARLVGASLVGASLVGASLDGASLDGASLDGASLDGASLVGASLDRIREDIRRVLDRAPAEVAGLLAKLRAGEVDGSCYEGSCACLVGTIANIRGVKFNALDGIAPDARSPAEKWFTGISRGHTPENNPVAAITEDWILEWQAERGEGEWIHELPEPEQAAEQ